jgi:hypothetical protein
LALHERGFNTSSLVAEVVSERGWLKESDLDASKRV